MRLVILSGGSGTRLWPLSNQVEAKQFLRVLPGTGERGPEPVSMLQRMIDQLGAIHRHDHIYISTTESQSEQLRAQLLPCEIPLIIEPSSRDTFPAIALSALYFYDVLNLPLDEVLCFCPVDLYVENAFFHKLFEAEQLLLCKWIDLVLVGIKPTYPAEKYGYIVPEETLETLGYLKVGSFVEKPVAAKAEELLADGALWNSGVFCFRLGFLIQYLREKGIPLTFAQCVAQYEQLPKISFDYQVAEKVNISAVLPFTGVWSDMGTWDALTQKVEAPVIGSGLLSDDCSNVHVINRLEIPVLGIGLSDIAIVCSENGILVTDKKSSEKMKEYLPKL